MTEPTPTPLATTDLLRSQLPAALRARLATYRDAVRYEAHAEAGYRQPRAPDLASAWEAASDAERALLAEQAALVARAEAAERTAAGAIERAHDVHESYDLLAAQLAAARDDLDRVRDTALAAARQIGAALDAAGAPVLTVDGHALSLAERAAWVAAQLAAAQAEIRALHGEAIVSGHVLAGVPGEWGFVHRRDTGARLDYRTYDAPAVLARIDAAHATPDAPVGGEGGA